jgi:hypothetical protein
VQRAPGSLRQLADAGEAVGAAVLDAAHAGESADPRDIGRLARPRRGRADAWHDVEHQIRRGDTLGTLAEQPAQRGGRHAVGVDEVQVAHFHGLQRRRVRAQG